MKELKEMTALVTGADGGIGMEFCRQLAAMGIGGIVMVSNRDDSLRHAAAEISAKGVKSYPLTLDLTASDFLTTLSGYLEERGLIIDILINNAGIFSFQPLTDVSIGKTECFLTLHVRAVTLLSRHFAQEMKQRGEGYILNMSSMSCWTPMPGLSLYAATKAYIRVLTRSLHYEMRDYGVKVMAAVPGGIATDLFGLPPNLMKLALQLRAVQRPDVFTRKALRRLLKGKQQYINGIINRLTIPFVGVMPTPVRMLVKHKLLDKGITR